MIEMQMFFKPELVSVDFTGYTNDEIKHRFDQLTDDEKGVFNLAVEASIENELRRAALSIRNKAADVFDEAMTVALRT